MEVTAKTDKGVVLDIGKREYWEIGMDLDGYQRLGAWEIKEIIDLSLPPRKTTEERFIKEFPEGTKSAVIEVKIMFYPAPKTELPVHQAAKTIYFEK
jgi:hypothetical protein